MEQNDNKNAILQMLLKEKGMNSFYPLKRVPVTNAWAYLDNEGKLFFCDDQLKPIPPGRTIYGNDMATLICFDGEAYWGLECNQKKMPCEKPKRLFLVLCAPLVKEDLVQEIDTRLRLYAIHETCYFLAETSGIKTRLFDSSCHYILHNDEGFTSDTLFLPPRSCLQPFADKGIRYWGSTCDFYHYDFFFATKTREWLIVKDNRLLMTTRNGLILFRIAKHQRVAVIDYPDVLTNTESYTDIKLKLQCLVNEWAPANYATIQFIPTDYRDFDSRFEHITARVGRFFEFEESVSFLLEYSERLYENEYSCKQGILITYSFEKDEKSSRIDAKFSSIPTNAEPDEITPDAVIFKDKLKTAYDRRTGRQLCQASPDANYGIIQQSGIYDFNSKKILLESAYANIVETNAFPFAAFIVSTPNLRKGIAQMEYGITTPTDLLLPPIYSRLSNIPCKTQNLSGETVYRQPSKGAPKGLKAPFLIEDDRLHKVGLMMADGTVLQPEYDAIYYSANSTIYHPAIILRKGSELHACLPDSSRPFSTQTDDIMIEKTFLIFDGKYIATCARPEMLLTHQGIPIEVHYVVDDTTFVGSNKIFRMQDDVPRCIYNGDNENLTFRDGGSDLCLFVRTEAIGSHDPNDYVCVEFLADGQLDFIPLYKFSRKDIDLEYNEEIKPGSYLCCGDYFYNIGENRLLSEKDIIEKTRNDYYDDGPDDYDYYRDTYYALGGDDYDALRRNGVDPGDAIDRLMDYQGY